MTPTSNSRALGPGERRLLRGAIEGRTIDEQARLLRCSRGQLVYRRTKLLRKLGARNITQAVAIALEAGLLEGPPRPVEKIGPRQRSAFYAKCGELDRTLGLDPRSTHDLALAAASDRIGRTISSVNDLSYEEASDVLDWLAQALEHEALPA